MKQCLALTTCVFAILTPISATAQMPTSEPSANAKELAKLLGPSELFQKPPMPAEWERKRTLDSMYSTTLAWKGEPCNEKDPRCSKVANEIATRVLNDRQTHQKQIAEYAYAVHFQNTMSDEDIDRTIAFIKTKQGNIFAKSLFSFPDIKKMKDFFNPGGDFFKRASAWTMTPYLEEFYDRTVGLPRTIRRAPPPPPRPPASKRPEGQ